MGYFRFSSPTLVHLTSVHFARCTNRRCTHQNCWSLIL